MTFDEVGWVWEGLGFDPGVQPSIYGVGEGAKYFGLERVNLLFHPINRITLGKLSDQREVIGPIMDYSFAEIRDDEGHFAFGHKCDQSPQALRREAEKLSRLSLQFPNVVGAIIDDAHGIFRDEHYNEDVPAEIYAALRSANPDLKLWIVVYSHEFEMKEWEPLVPNMDVANLWVWNCQDIPHLAEYVERCAEVFPGKDIIVGAYMRDYPSVAAVPLDLMELQYQTMYDLWQQSKIAGYSVLAACLIDQHPEQAEFIRNFIAEH